MESTIGACDSKLFHGAGVARDLFTPRPVLAIFFDSPRIRVEDHPADGFVEDRLSDVVVCCECHSEVHAVVKAKDILGLEEFVLN